MMHTMRMKENMKVKSKRIVNLILFFLQKRRSKDFQDHHITFLHSNQIYF